jgi:hypothetical protein
MRRAFSGLGDRGIRQVFTTRQACYDPEQFGGYTLTPGLCDYMMMFWRGIF